MKLYLVRHGLAKSSDEDPRQPLNSEGEFMAKQIGQFLGGLKGFQTAEIRHSTKERARKTAHILAEFVGQPVELRESEALAPMAEVRDMAEEMKTADHNLMLVGHLPHLARLASKLLFDDLGHDIFDIPPAGVICLERMDEESAKRWYIRWMVTPELLAKR